MQKLKPAKYQPNLSFTQELSLKDFSVKSISRHFPEVTPLLEELLPLIPHKKFLTVDYSKLILAPGDTTCRDINWHVDGKDNLYLLIAFGDFRTKFLKKTISLPSEVFDLKITNLILQGVHKKDEGIEVDNGVPYLYSSKDVHRGQQASFTGKRIFLRICSSDYLEPKNKVLKK